MPIVSPYTSSGEVRVAESYVDLIWAVVIAVPILGLFFPWESYISFPSIDNPTGMAPESSRLTTVVFSALAAIIVALYVRSPRIRGLLYTNWPILLFIAWAFASVIWAEDPGYSFNRTGRMLIYALYAIYAVESMDTKRLTRVLIFAILIGLAGSLAVTIVSPGLSRSTDLRGAWRGGYAGKNAFGPVSACGILIGLFAPKQVAVGWPLRWLLIVGSSVAIVATNSITPVFATIAASLVVVYLGMFTRSRPAERLAALLVLFVGVSCLYLLKDVLADSLDIVGRDATLTGRTSVWAFADLVIDMKPVLGWGHGAWSGAVFSSMIMPVLHWPFPHAHNTWLDLRIQLGVPGLALGVLTSVLAAARSLNLTLVSRSAEHLVWIALLIFFGVLSYVETLLVDPAISYMFWFALISASLTKLSRTASRMSTMPVARLQAAR